MTLFSSDFRGIFTVLFEKACMEHGFAAMYAEFSKALMAKLEFTEGEEKVTLRDIIVAHTLYEFKQQRNAAPESETEGDEEKAIKSKTRAIGMIKFISELFNKEVLVEEFVPILDELEVPCSPCFVGCTVDTPFSVSSGPVARRRGLRGSVQTARDMWTQAGARVPGTCDANDGAHQQGCKDRRPRLSAQVHASRHCRPFRAQMDCPQSRWVRKIPSLDCFLSVVFFQQLWRQRSWTTTPLRLLQRSRKRTGARRTRRRMPPRSADALRRDQLVHREKLLALRSGLSVEVAVRHERHRWHRPRPRSSLPPRR